MKLGINLVIYTPTPPKFGIFLVIAIVHRGSLYLEKKLTKKIANSTLTMHHFIEISKWKKFCLCLILIKHIRNQA